MKRFTMFGCLAMVLLTACGEPSSGDAVQPTSQDVPQRNDAIRLPTLWAEGQPAFGIFVPDEDPPTREERRAGERRPPTYTRDGIAQLARNPLYDFLFLNLEGDYDPGVVKLVLEGLDRADTGQKPDLLVRIPPISRAGEEQTRQRVEEILGLGADGVVLPHIRNLEEAQTAIGFFSDYQIWSPSNADGNRLAMLMLEDPAAVAQAEEIAALGGFSILACGIGSLTQALGGDREAAEAGNQRVLEAATEAGLADMITAEAENIERRIEQGFRALLMRGPSADETIRIGRRASGREE